MLRLTPNTDPYHARAHSLEAHRRFVREQIAFMRGRIPWIRQHLPDTLDEWVKLMYELRESNG